MRFNDYVQPASLAEAVSALKRLGAAGYPVAGGTSTVFLPGDERKVGVDINRLGLAGITRAGDHFRIGATTRLAELQKYRGEGWVLDRVAVNLATQQIRNMSTIGGNIARVFPWADFPVALLALGGVMVIHAGADKQVPVDEYFASQPSRFYGNGELLTAVNVPAVGAGAGFGYRKQRQTSGGFSLVTAAALLSLSGHTLSSARVAIGGGVPFPVRVRTVEAELAGKRASEDLLRGVGSSGVAGLRFKSSAGMSEEYIGHLAGVTVGDALCEALAAARGGAA